MAPEYRQKYGIEHSACGAGIEYYNVGFSALGFLTATWAAVQISCVFRETFSKL